MTSPIISTLVTRSLLFFCALFSFFGIARATADTFTPGTMGEPVAYVEVANATVTSQSEGVLSLFFDIVNGEGLQSGVKYAVILVQQTQDKKQFIVDEHVYDEVLTVHPNSTLKKTVTYTPPPSLSGTYTLLIGLANESGFPFARVIVGDTTLAPSVRGLELLVPTCTYTIGSDSSVYPIIRGLDIGANEVIRLSCDVVNHSKSAVSAVPTYETHNESLFGATVAHDGGTTAPIAFSASEKKRVTLELPKVSIAGKYVMTIALSDGGTVSNKAQLRYITRGVITSIHKLSLDKDFYRKGETARVFYLWSSPAPSFIRDSKGESVKMVPLSVSAQLVDGKGDACADPVSASLVMGTPLRPQEEIAIPITARCEHPTLTAIITDKAGTVYDKKTFSFETKEAPGLGTGARVALLVILTAILVGGVRLLIHKKRQPTAPIVS